MGRRLSATSLYEVPKYGTVKDEKTKIDTKTKLIDLLKLSRAAFKKLDGLKYRKYHKNIKLQLELIDYYKILVDYSNQLLLLIKRSLKRLFFLISMIWKMPYSMRTSGLIPNGYGR